jgi:hypothetical protein
LILLNHAFYAEKYGSVTDTTDKMKKQTLKEVFAAKSQTLIMRIFPLGRFPSTSCRVSVSMFEDEMPTSTRPSPIKKERKHPRFTGKWSIAAAAVGSAQRGIDQPIRDTNFWVEQQQYGPVTCTRCPSNLKLGNYGRIELP